MGLIPDLCPSHWNLSQTIPNLAIICFTTPTLDTKGVVEIVIELIAIDIAIEISSTSDSSGHGSDIDTEFRLLEADNRLVLPFFIESQVSIPRLGVKQMLIQEYLRAVFRNLWGLSQIYARLIGICLREIQT